MRKGEGSAFNLWLLAILWLALILRLFLLDEQFTWQQAGVTRSLWYDEGVTWYLTRFSLPEMVRWTAADIQPPFYYVLIWGTTRLFGESEWALRFPSAIFGVLSVPLLWQLGRYLFKGRQFGYLAAGLMTLSPLMVYYSQEARMYTLLVFQAGLTGYLFLRIMENRAGNRAIVAYSLTMASALYTHYFAAFLLLGHGLYFLLVLLRDREVGPNSGLSMPIAHRFRQGLILFIGTGLLFAPWLSVLLARLGDDPSYWPGVLKLNEVVQDVFISFAVGGKREMIFEVDGLRLAAGFGLLLLVAIVLLGLRRSGRARLSFLLLWLVVPIALILLLSYRTPKFNPRYTMLAWPAFALILAGGLGQLWPFDSIGKLPMRRLFAGLTLIAALLFVSSSWGFSLHNWYFVPEFSRDDFKHVARFIQERSFLNEPVLLSSGHMFPVWLYYSDKNNWTPLPKMETLDVNRVTGFDIVPQLETALQGTPGVWLVSWQDEVVDPNGVVPLLLDLIGQRSVDPLLQGQFWGVDLQYWHLPQKLHFPTTFPPDHITDFNFGNLVKLCGLWLRPDDQTEAVLFWEPLQILDDDYLISLRLVDGADISWSDGVQVARPAAYLYPTQRWQPGKMVPGRQRLPWLTGTPPGQYWLEVGWLKSNGEGIDLLDADGNPQRRTILLGPVEVTHPVQGEESSLTTPASDLGSLQLLKADFEAESAEAGSRVLFDALWQVEASSEQSPPQIVTLSAWEDEQGNRYPLEKPISLEFDSTWAAGTMVRSRSKLATPYQAQPGPVRLFAEITFVDRSRQVTPLAGLVLQATERNFVPPTALDIKTNANFAGLARLIGASLSQNRLKVGESTPLTLYWQAEGTFTEDYTVFVHLLGLAGTPILNLDHTPPRPTSNWLEGEIIADSISLTIPTDLPPGRYPVEVGLYNTTDPNYARLPLQDSTAGGRNYIILTELEVTAP